jgi:3-deoxy-7-phosphoheptulonate synthase
MERSAPSVLVLDPRASESDIAVAVAAAAELLPGARVTRGDAWAAVPLGDGVRSVDGDRFELLPSVRRVVQVSAPYRLASREVFGEDVAIEVPLCEGADRHAGAAVLGGRAPLGVIVSSRWGAASEARFELLAPLLREAGCSVFHAGQLALPSERGSATALTVGVLRGLRDIAHEHGLAVCVEAADASQIAPAMESADLLQVGSRNMQDFSLLREMGGIDRPVLLRRGAGATVEEFLLAAEYVLLHGNGRVILCESGIRTFDALQKPRFEINAVPLIKSLSHLPLVADPSQTAPHAATVPAMAKAAIAAGADGLVLEVGTEAVYDPDGVAIDIETMRTLVAELRPIARAVGRSFDTRAGSEQVLPANAAAILRLTERTLAQTIESITDVPPHLEVLDQWRLAPPIPWLSPPLSPDGEVLARCTSYRMGSVRLSCNVSYVDLARIDPTLGALLEAKHLNLGQLFVDPRIEKLEFEFGTEETAGEIDEVFRHCFPDERDDLSPYVWRRYQAAVGGVVTFLVIEALPVRVWERLLDPGATVPMVGGRTG